MIVRFKFIYALNIHVCSVIVKYGIYFKKILKPYLSFLYKNIFSNFIFKNVETRLMSRHGWVYMVEKYHEFKSSLKAIEVWKEELRRFTLVA